ncbi:BOP1NT (NUC169) domain containing protein [Amanita muscaria]
MALKRKKASQNESDDADELKAEIANLEMLTDEEEEEQDDSASFDDGQVDDFPEIVQSSDEDESESEDVEDEEDVDEHSSSENDSDTDDDSELHIFPKAKTVVSQITGQPKLVYPDIEPEYDSDSSTEDAPNRVGNIPMHWYDDLPHIGYDINGKKVLRPARGDELDKFLATVEDPSTWTSAFDKNTQTDKSLTAQELDIIRRLYENENPDAAYDPYEPMTEWFTGKGKEEIMPLSAAPEPKRRWVPSRWEKQKVMKIVRAIRQGRILPSKPKSTTKMEFYAIWSQPTASVAPPPPAPKLNLPSHSESYNPPEEFLPTEEERKEWEEQDVEDREKDYLPKKYSSLRLVPAYDRFIKERFNRQLDLYLAPRVQRVKLNIDPNSLLPKLPSPNSLKPFPTYRSLRFVQSSGRVRCMSISPEGDWVVSGDENGIVILWEVNVGREVKRWKFSGKIGALDWCPRTDACYFVVTTEETIYFLIPPNLTATVFSLTHSLLAPTNLPPTTSSPVKWETASSGTWTLDKPILTVKLPPASGLPIQTTWHRRGDYLATVSNNGAQGGVWIHQITRRHSQAPFKKIKGVVQVVLFHPSKPHFFVATQQYVRLYNLAEQKLVKTFMPGIRWISSMDVHPSGDHLIVGGYDRKLCWFDLELSDKPFKVMRYHSRAIRSLHFHPTYPLFASSSDDGSIQIFHSRVYSDLMTDPLIVPLKILRGHQIREGLGVLQVRWCHSQPWLLSAGADGSVAVWCS